MLKIVKTSQYQGTSGILESWIQGSRHHNIFSIIHKINTDMLHRLVYSLPHSEADSSREFYSLCCPPPPPMHLNSFCLSNLFLSSDSFSFALQGGLQGGDEDNEDEDSFVWTTEMLMKDHGKAWGSRPFLAVA